MGFLLQLLAGIEAARCEHLPNNAAVSPRVRGEVLSVTCLLPSL